MARSRVQITAINFHDADGATSFNFAGSRGYALPQGRVSIAVDFRVAEADDQYTVFTEILSAGHYGGYDELVKAAYRQLVDRLDAFGALARELRASFEESKSSA